MKKFLVLAILTLFTGMTLYAERTAVIKSVSGKVEYRLDNAGWTTAKAGMKLPLKATLSTGFDSRAVIEIGATTLNVAPLTRMRIDQLSEKEGVATTGVTLQVGRVKSDVKPVEGLQTDFVIKSPVTTASVRGTRFEFDAENTTVEEGTVVVTDAYNNYLAVRSGESAASGSDGVTAEREAALEVSIDAGDIGSSLNAGAGGGFAPDGAALEFGRIKVEWTYYNNL